MIEDILSSQARLNGKFYQQLCILFDVAITEHHAQQTIAQAQAAALSNNIALTNAAILQSMNRGMTPRVPGLIPPATLNPGNIVRADSFLTGSISKTGL